MSAGKTYLWTYPEGVLRRTVRVSDERMARSIDRKDYAAQKTFAKDDKPGLSKKTVNNHLTVLRRILVVAKKRGLLDAVPEIEWLRAPRPDFDVLDFEEADRLLKAADGEWRWMMLIALRTGLRQGELLALRWEDVDLETGLLRVRQSATRDHVTEPKSGKGRVGKRASTTSSS